MTAYDAHWFATQAAAAAWVLAFNVEGTIQDIEAALAMEDYATAMESSSLALLELGHCSLVVAGVVRTPYILPEVELLAVLAAYSPDVLERISTLPAATSADRPDAERALRLVRDTRDQVRAGLPFELPMTRTPTGFFPSVRVANQLERLRRALGLGGFEWRWE